MKSTHTKKISWDFTIDVDVAIALTHLALRWFTREQIAEWTEDSSRKIIHSHCLGWLLSGSRLRIYNLIANQLALDRSTKNKTKNRTNLIRLLFVSQSIKIESHGHRFAPTINNRSLFSSYTHLHIFIQGKHTHTQTLIHVRSSHLVHGAHHTKSSVIIWDHSRNRIIFTFFSFYGCIRLSYEILMNRRLFCRLSLSLSCLLLLLMLLQMQLESITPIQKQPCLYAQIAGHAVMFSLLSLSQYRSHTDKTPEK